MASIRGGDNTKIFAIQKFLGLNESLDGDTQLRMGEASGMDNWRVTPQYHLRVRPGLHTLWSFDGPVRGMWCGELGGEMRLVCAAEGKLWELTEEDGGLELLGKTYGRTQIGTLTDAPVSFFGFGNKLYFLNGHEYLSWDGNGSAAAVEGYIPLVVTAASPAGGGTQLEAVNRLTAKRRVRFSADGTALEFQLPEQNLESVDRIQADGADKPAAAYAADLENGRVTFLEAPPQGVNNVEIWYTAASDLREQVEKMRFAESYNGSTDTRVFLYGDGTNKTIYSGVTEDGIPSAEYFPDLNEIAVDSENTPITGMVKQFSYLMIFKTDGAYSTQYSAITLVDGTVTAGFYVSPVNKEIGNEAPGQVRAVYNYPRTLYAGNLYDWRTVSTGRDERRAKLVSDRVRQTVHASDPQNVYCFDNEREQEYYLFLNDKAGTALVHRYQYEGGGDVWYRYTGLPVTCGVREGEDVWFGLSDGRVCAFSNAYKSDDGNAIPCQWRSGNMDFGADYLRKHSSLIWVSLKPDSNARITVTATTDKRSSYTVKRAASNLATFLGADFRHWSFITNRNPQIERVKLKVKKFAFYRLIIECSEDSATTAVLGVDLRIRYTGYVK